MKLFLCVMLTCATMLEQTLIAQTDAFEAKKNYLSVGYAKEAYSAKSVYPKGDKQNYSSSGFGAITLKFEHAVADEIGIGIVLGYSESSVSWSEQVNTGSTQTSYHTSLKIRKMTAVARMNWHFFTDESWDAYCGIGVGYKDFSDDFNTQDPDFVELGVPSVKVAMSMSAGLRYYFNPQFGLFVETGMGHGYVQGGLQMKF